jgi:hypothetical protein
LVQMFGRDHTFIGRVFNWMNTYICYWQSRILEGFAGDILWSYPCKSFWEIGWTGSLWSRWLPSICLYWWYCDTYQ